ncbi:cobalamin biosynthesis protein [Streptomyces sp. SID3343]|uniref:cobalamin biosynthesis protein n=1 Tax=Streptomyces sp. SID3343 TaxID=2690260 RepID=UPI001F3A43CB|nr:cobalamin biosynthesis protein [Streptomyces sp. SID3343]
MSSRAVLVVGVGAARGVTAEEVVGTVRAVLAGAGLAGSPVVALATVRPRADEAGLVAAAKAMGLPLYAHDARDLAGVSVPNPSERTRAAVGTPGVAEAAARVGTAVGGPLGVLVVAKTRGVGARARCTVAVARHVAPAEAAASAVEFGVICDEVGVLSAGSTPVCPVENGAAGQ